MSDLAGNPEDRFSRVEALIIISVWCIKIAGIYDIRNTFVPTQLSFLLINKILPYSFPRIVRVQFISERVLGYTARLVSSVHIDLLGFLIVDTGLTVGSFHQGPFGWG